MSRARRWLQSIVLSLALAGMGLAPLACAQLPPDLSATRPLARPSMAAGTVRPSTVPSAAPPRATLPTAAPWPAPARDSYIFGVINDERQHYADEWARGVRATLLELHWYLYEPQEGVFDTAYIEGKKQELAALRAQGWYVQLVPGYQYVPDWVYARFPDAYYVNQYGERYDDTRGDYRVINAPFNSQARALIAAYLARIFQDFDPGDFDSVRLGGGVQGELRYPPGEWNGHINSYWAFDSHAQNPAESGIPAEVVAWRPGIDPNPGSVDRGQLIVNPGFEQIDPHFPVVAWSPDDEVTAEPSTFEPHAGARALRLTISTADRVHQYVRVTPGASYRFGGWLRSGGGAGRARIFLNQYISQTQPAQGTPFGLLETPATTWTYLTGTLAVSSDTNFLKVELDGHQPGTYSFDDLWLEREGETRHDSRDILVPLAFYEWYIQSLTDYQNWQISEIRRYYGGPLDVIYAGKGLRSNQVTAALVNDMRGDAWSEDSSALYAGSLYGWHVAGLSTTQDIALYVTGIELPSGGVDDSSPYPRDWSAARWIAELARSRGLAVWGENGGHNDAAALQLAAQRMQANGFVGLLWAFESDLYADPNPNGYATIDEYGAVIAGYNRGHPVYLPTVVK